jgi:hypothetical protein
MEQSSHADLVERLAALPVGEFVHVMRLTFDARLADGHHRYFDDRYALAQVANHPPRPGYPREWEIRFVAYPTEPPVEPGLFQGGTCLTCGREAVSTNKRALCAICDTLVGLT